MTKAQPYRSDDLSRAEQIVGRLHGVSGFAAWADLIAKELAAERERAAHVALAIDSKRGNESMIAECLRAHDMPPIGDSRRPKSRSDR